MAPLFAALGVATDAAVDVGERVNAAAMPRFPWLARLLTSRSPARRMAGALVPDRLGRRLDARLKAANDRPFSPPPLPVPVRDELRGEFAPMVRLLETAISRDLSRWAAAPEPA